MRIVDLMALSVSDLWQRKLRSAFTLTGIILGTVLFLLVTSGGMGVMQAVERQYRSNDDLRRIEIYSNYVPSTIGISEEDLVIEGDMSDERRERLQVAIARHHENHQYVVEHSLPPALLVEWSNHRFVELVEPDIHLFLQAGINGQIERVQCLSFWDPGLLEEHLVAGTGFDGIDDDTVVINEYLAYRWGAKNETDVAAMIGRTIHLEYREDEGSLAQSIGWMRGSNDLFSVMEARSLEAGVRQVVELIDQLDLPQDQREALIKAFGDWDELGEDATQDDSELAEDEPFDPVVSTGDFRITGVYRDPDETNEHPRRHRLLNGEVLMPAGRARRFADPIILTKDPPDYSAASIVVDSESHLREVQNFVEESGVETYSLVEFIENVHLRIRFITLILAGLAFSALFVAGLGIANTMTMSVLERSREIGIMKAVGARDRQILLLFLTEGLWLGLLGSVFGIGVGMAIAHWVTGWVKGIVEGEFDQAFDQPMFAFPLVLISGLVALVVAVTVTASLIPAMRAARIDPIRTLKAD